MVGRITGVVGACGLLLAALLAALRPRRVAVVGGSMLPLLEPGDHLLVIRTGRPLPGALVVVRAPSGVEVVKRVGVVSEAGVWVVGDNAGASTDSRTWGVLPLTAVRGRPVYRYAPADRAGPLRVSAGLAPHR